MKKTSAFIIFLSTFLLHAQSDSLKINKLPKDTITVIKIDPTKIKVIKPHPIDWPFPRVRNIVNIEEVIIRSLQKHKSQAHPAFETIKSQELEIRNTGQDLPMLLQFQTGIVSTSDAGNGIGYTGIRMRGSDATRTNISVNGVPINDAESQGTFWVNMPDLASSASNIHIQRGLGSSVHGAGSFGGGVMIQTGTKQTDKAEFDLTFGSYNTRKITAKFYSPFIKLIGKSDWTYDLRISHIGSNGFIDRAGTELYGYMGSLQSHNIRGWNHKFMVFGGVEKTYQAWWGIPIEKYNLGNKGNNSKDTQALYDHYFRNIGTYRNYQDSSNLFNSNPNRYNYYLFPNETDNYQQHHFHYYGSKNWNSRLNVNHTVYYTYGSGYFEQFRFQDDVTYYGISPEIQNTDTLSTANLVRQRWLQNHLIGINTHLTYRPNNDHIITAGFGASRYIGQHFGRVIAVGKPINDVEILENNPNLNSQLPIEYYRSSGNKTDINLFGKWMYYPEFSDGLNMFTDLQLRYVKHDGLGTDNDLINIDFTGEFLFFNPKAGIYYTFSRNHSKSEYQASVSVGNREPARSDFVDNVSGEVPKPERLIDYEFGYTWSHRNKSQLSINLYYMDYYNQLVLTGALNDVGTPLRQNVDRSYRRGIEIGLQKPVFDKDKQKLRLIANGAFSQNRIVASPASWVDYLDNSTFDTIYSNAPIAYSPDLVASAGINYEIRKNSNRYELQFLQKYVSQQFLDNTGNDYRSIPAYTFSELQFAFKRLLSDQRSVQVKLQIQNLFNNRYLNNGYTWGYLYDRQLIQEVFVFPSAPTNFSLSLSMVW